MINEIIEYIKSKKEFISTDEIKRKFNLSEQEWEIVFPFLLSDGIKINTFDTMNLKCNDCPIKGYCNKKSCGG
ncbi:hypothetical protein JCM30566_03840 [Marinitoga arctica]